VKFRFMAAEKASYPLALMCRVLDVSRSGFYAWQSRKTSDRELRNQALKVRIHDLHQRSRRIYGSPRIQLALKEEGISTSRKRVASLMREEGLRGRKGRKPARKTSSLPDAPAAPNLLKRNFTTSAPNRVWVTDVTAIWTREGWLYLAVVLDLYSRKVVGWSMQNSPTLELCMSALQMAIDDRRPEKGLIHHSDRGSQYTSHAYQQMLSAHGMVCSMSRRANCWDNAVAESFFATLKVEIGVDGHRGFTSREQAKSEVFRYIEGFYNRVRMHSAIGNTSPTKYEMTQPRGMLAA
jgi:putative transposase